MPIYEYDCPKCGRFEVLQKLNEKNLKFCPSCAGRGKKTKVERLVSPAAFHLKGTGWYQTDYAAKSSCGKSKSGNGKSEAATGEDKSTQATVSSGSAKANPANIPAKSNEPGGSKT